jgi:mannose-6-phosphate isomerase
LKPAPARLEPVFSPRIWGAKSLAPLYPEKINLAEPIGEAWLTAHEIRFADGPFAGETLGAAWKKMPREWRGVSAANFEEFPLLVKFLFPMEKLSIQVHPDDAYAAKYEAAAGGRGKTEMWYVVAAELNAAVWLGLKPEVTADSFRRAIEDGTAENLVERVPVRVGDAIFCPARTVHYSGPGMTLCEIQEYSDLTYRVFDYNRRGADGKLRELHLESAFKVIRFGAQKGGKVEPARVRRDGVDEAFLVACEQFAVESIEFDGAFAMRTTVDQFEILIAIEGAGTIENAGASHAFARGQAWFIPAGAGEYRFVASTPAKFLRTFVPKDLADFERGLRENRVPEAVASRLVFR